MANNLGSVHFSYKEAEREIKKIPIRGHYRQTMIEYGCAMNKNINREVLG